MAGADLADRLERLLARERRAIGARQLDALDAIAREKEALCAQLAAQAGKGVPAPGTAGRLARAARRNEALLAAVLEGLRAARAVLAAARSGGAGLSTYDAQGRRHVLAPQPGATPARRR